MSDETRAHPRFALEIETEVRRGDRVMPARTRDVSRGGICVLAPEAVPLGGEVELMMALVFDAETVSEPLNVRARVVWCTRLADRYQLGVTFVGMTSEQRNYLEMFLRYLAEGRKREREASPPDADEGPFG